MNASEAWWSLTPSGVIWTLDLHIAGETSWAYLAGRCLVGKAAWFSWTGSLAGFHHPQETKEATPVKWNKHWCFHKDNLPEDSFSSSYLIKQQQWSKVAETNAKRACISPFPWMKTRIISQKLSLLSFNVALKLWCDVLPISISK